MLIVAAITTPNVLRVRKDTPLKKPARILRPVRINGVPVAGDEGAWIGILGKADRIRTLIP